MLPWKIVIIGLGIGLAAVPLLAFPPKWEFVSRMPLMGMAGAMLVGVLFEVAREFTVMGEKEVLIASAAGALAVCAAMRYTFWRSQRQTGRK